MIVSKTTIAVTATIWRFLEKYFLKLSFNDIYKIKKFSFPQTKSPIRFCPQNWIQISRRAKRGDPPIVDFFSVVYLYNSARTYFIKNSWIKEAAPPPLANARRQAKYSLQFLICARPIFSSKRKTKLFFGVLLLTEQGGGASLWLAGKNFRWGWHSQPPFIFCPLATKSMGGAWRRPKNGFQKIGKSGFGAFVWPNPNLLWTELTVCRASRGWNEIWRSGGPHSKAFGLLRGKQKARIFVYPVGKRSFSFGARPRFRRFFLRRRNFSCQRSWRAAWIYYYLIKKGIKCKRLTN